MDVEAKQRLIEVVKKARGGRSLRGFARAVGVSVTTVQAWESGQFVPERDNLTRIAASAGMSLDELLDRLDGKPVKEPIDQILEQVRYMPLSQVAEISKAIAERFASAAESTSQYKAG